MRNWGGEFGEGKRARLRIERVGGGRPLSFGPCAHRRWPTRAMSLSCRQPLAAARCRLSPPPSVRSFASRFLSSSAATAASPPISPLALVFRRRPTLPFASSFRRSRPSLRSSSVFVFCCCHRLARLSVRPPVFCQIGVLGKIAMLLHEKGVRDAKSAEMARTNRCASVLSDIKAREERVTRSTVRAQNNCEQAFLAMAMRTRKDLRRRLPK